MGAIDTWKDAATAELTDIKEASGNMLPEDRVARTMDLQEDIAAKLEILKGCAAKEKNFFPKATRFQLMLRPSRMNLQELQSTQLNLEKRQRLNATNTPMMSSTGLNTGQESRSSTLGWQVPRKQLEKVFPSLHLLMKSRPSTTRFLDSIRTVLTI